MYDSYFTVDFEMGKIVVYTGPGEEILGVDFDLEDRVRTRPSGCHAARLFAAYFRGEKLQLDLDADLTWESAFRQKVYARVRNIPSGQTLAYGEIAAQAGSPGGGRAVGQAMAANRFPLIIPCHRVISGNGGIGGFSSDIGLKKYLLRLEGAVF